MATKPTAITKYAQTRYNLTSVANRKTNGTVKYIVDHYTGTNACAKNNCIFFGGGDRQASADFFVDKDGAIYQFNKNLNAYYSWHCGDGYGAYGITNRNSIGIEVVSSGAVFTKAQQESLRKLHLWLMDEYNIPASRVVRHYDASRKLCPYPYAGTTAKNKKWKTLREFTTTKSPSATNKKTATTDAAKFYAKSLNKAYVTTDDLNLRSGAGTGKTVKVEMPDGTKVRCYGYYTSVGSTKWLLVEATVGKTKYTGFCSKKFLKAI